MAYQRTTGIVLRTTDYSETSQIVAVLSPDMGQIHLLAKGSRRPRKDGRVPLDLLNYCDMVIARKAAGQLHILAEYHLKENFPGIRADLQRIAAALYADEVALAFTQESPEDGHLCGLMLEFLRGLNRGDEIPVRLFRFLGQGLQILGSAPMTESCAHCGEALHGMTRFAPAAGGALCGDCAGGYPQAFPISRGALAIMSRFSLRERPGEAALRLSPAQAEEIRRAFNEQIQYHLGKPLRTGRLISQVL